MWGSVEHPYFQWIDLAAEANPSSIRWPLGVESALKWRPIRPEIAPNRPCELDGNFKTHAASSADLSDSEGFFLNLTRRAPSFLPRAAHSAPNVTRHQCIHAD
jgi:hypothetical protein